MASNCESTAHQKIVNAPNFLRWKKKENCSSFPTRYSTKAMNPYRNTYIADKSKGKMAAYAMMMMMVVVVGGGTFDIKRVKKAVSFIPLLHTISMNGCGKRQMPH